MDEQDEANRLSAVATNEAKYHLVKALGEVRSSVQKLTTDIGDVRVIQERLKTKGWGAGALQFLELNTAEQQASCAKLFDAWTLLKAKDVDSMGAADIDNGCRGHVTTLIRIMASE